MESQDVLKIHGALRRYCTSRVLLRSTLEVQYLLNLPYIFNTSLDSMLYLLITYRDSSKTSMKMKSMDLLLYVGLYNNIGG